MSSAGTSNKGADWRVFIVHAVAKAVGVQFKVESIPFGARCHFRASAGGLDALRGFNRASSAIRTTCSSDPSGTAR